MRFRALLALVVLLVPAAPAAAQRAEWRIAVAELLARRASAIERADEAALLATMEGAPRAYRTRSLRSMRRLHALPLDSYSLRLEDRTWTDLSPLLGERRAAGADEIRVVHAIERVRLRGWDPAPTSESAFLTVVRRGSGWAVVADDDLDAFGLRSVRHPWDLAPVRTLEREGVLVLHDGDAATARRILSATIAAKERVRGAWPYAWPDRAVLVIPSSLEDLAAILQVTFDLGPFVAFLLSSTHVGERGELTFASHRVYVQPATFFGYSAAFQSEVLGHELLHLASRPVTGAFVPAWLDEGVALVYGERPAAPRDLPGAVRAGRVRGVPDDVDFVTGSSAEIRVSYEASASFVRWLGDRYGRNAGARLYRALGRMRAVSFGTARYHLDRAARRVFARPFGRLERAWVNDLRTRYGA